MKPTPKSKQKAEGRGQKNKFSRSSALIPHPSALSAILAFGPHPDDIEFGVGGVIVKETRAGRKAHFVVCSRGESATNGTPEERKLEAEKAASMLGATLEFIDLDGDAHLEMRATHSITLARIIRRLRPAVILAPSLVENQHPDHYKLGALVRDAAKLARYGGFKELKDVPPHTIEHLFYYAGTPETEPRDITPILIDVSEPSVMSAWRGSMEAHVTQHRTRNYVDLQIARARVRGLCTGVEYAIAIFPNDPLVVDSL